MCEKWLSILKKKISTYSEIQYKIRLILQNFVIFMQLANT